MDAIQKIKAEIERRLKANGAFDEVGDDAWAYDQGIVDAYKSILSFIKSLEKEPEIDFETEYAKFSNDVDTNNPLPIDLADYKDFARHFYELGLNVKEQKLIDEKVIDGIGKSVRKKWALDFINYLDVNRYSGKMCVSNGECADIENAFISADWNKLFRYYTKFLQKPAEKKETEKIARISPGLLSNFGTSTYVLDVDFTQEEKEKLNLAGFSNGTIKIKILCE